MAESPESDDSYSENMCMDHKGVKYFMASSGY